MYNYEKTNNCPLCRQNIELLPVVNGLKKLIRGIHYTSEEYKNELNYENKPCKHILKSGKNKGQTCNCNCKIKTIRSIIETIGASNPCIYCRKRKWI